MKLDFTLFAYLTSSVERTGEFPAKSILTVSALGFFSIDETKESTCLIADCIVSYSGRISDLVLSGKLS